MEPHKKGGVNCALTSSTTPRSTLFDRSWRSHRTIGASVPPSHSCLGCSAVSRPLRSTFFRLSPMQNLFTSFLSTLSVMTATWSKT